MSGEKRAIKNFPLPSSCHFQWPVFQDWWHHTPGRHHLQPSDLSLNHTQAEGTDLHRQIHTWKQRLWTFRVALASSQWRTFQKEIMGTVLWAPCVFGPVGKLCEKETGVGQRMDRTTPKYFCAGHDLICVEQNHSDFPEGNLSLVGNYEYWLQLRIPETNSCRKKWQ